MTEAGLLRAASPGPLTDGARVQVGFRPEAVHIGSSDVNELRTAIAHVSYLGEIEQYALELAPGRVIKAFEQNPLEIRKVGAPLTVHVRPRDVLVLPVPVSPD
jgi:ABC-type Fe3+/spermidine/putrescine transport system ATPase subunit